MRCAVEVAPVRAEAVDDAEQVTQLLRGEPVRVERRGDGWAHVVTAYDYPGWVRGDQLEEGVGEFPPPSGGSLLDEARRYLGAPYLWGGMTSMGIDCSGLVHMAHRRLGRLVPRDSWQQEEAGARVDAPEPGDVLVYGDPGRRADHVALLGWRRVDLARHRTRFARCRRGARTPRVGRSTALDRASLAPSNEGGQLD